MLLRHPELRPLFEKCWRANSTRNVSRAPVGPVNLARDSNAAIGWTWVAPFHFITDNGASIHLITCSEGGFAHLVRERLRRMLWQRAADRRADMEGLEQGLDREASTQLLRSRRLTPHAKGTLRSILSGAVWTQEKLAEARLAETAVCQYGRQSFESTHDMFWTCAA